MLVETTSILAGAITGAIRKAAQATGAGFDYLLATARIESGLNPTIRAKTTSATGLFQFIEQTWLATMKQAGPGLGYGGYAKAISEAASGRHYVSDPLMREKILSLRKDPAANAVMAGAFTRANAAKMKAKLGRAPTDGELYMAHFLGAGGATKLIAAAQANPGEKATRIFPAAAAANRGIFYTKQGGARSVAQVYRVLAGKLDRARDVGLPQVAQAAIPMPAAAPARLRSVPAVEIAALPPLQANASAPVYAQQPQAQPDNLPVRAARASGGTAQPVFHSLFHDDGRGAVSTVVAELWGAKAATPPGPNLGGGQALDKPVDVFGLTRHQRVRS